MNKQFLSWMILAIVLFCHFTVLAEPIVTNVRAAQKPGTKQVEIFYDVSGSPSPAHVSLLVSSDGGTTFSVPVNTLSGDIGANIPLGRNKKILWNAGVDWNNKLSNAIRFRVGASSIALPAPVLASPTNNRTEYYNAPAHPRHTFRWEAVEGAEYYRLIVYGKNTGLVLVDRTVSETSFTPDIDLYSLRWQVSAGRSGYFGPLSPKWTLNVIVFTGGGES